MQRSRVTHGVKRVKAKIGSMVLGPEDWITVFPLQAAHAYPAFQRGYDNERAAVRAVKVVEQHTMTKYDRSVVLDGLVAYLERAGIDGAFVECGVWRGGSAGLMALANMRYSERRRELHLFDAWDDWPDPTEEDGNRFADLQRQELAKADNDGAEAACRRLLEHEIGYPRERLHYHKGLFDETLADTSQVGRIALLRIDSDWYESTKQCLDALYPQVAPGGLIVFDDYGYCDGARRAVDAFLGGLPHPLLLHFVDYSCRYVQKPGVSGSR